MGQGSGIAMSCVVGLRSGSDPPLLGLWCRPAATVPIQPLAWELPYAALKNQQKNLNNKKYDSLGNITKKKQSQIQRTN